MTASPGAMLRHRPGEAEDFGLATSFIRFKSRFVQFINLRVIPFT